MVTFILFIFSVGRFSRWLHLFLVSGGLAGGYIYF